LGRPQNEESYHPVVMFGQAILHGASRNKTHISVIACVSAAGESFLPYRVTLQNSSTIQEHLKKQGIRFGRDLILKFNQESYISVSIFLNYMRTVFLPYIDALRAWQSLHEKSPFY
jgi:hypothetical protein